MRFRSMLRKCTSRMRNILTMHVPDSTLEYLRKRNAFLPCASCTFGQDRRPQKGETHDPY
jgi:hypothetical protein